MTCISESFASDPSLPVPTATLKLSTLLDATGGEPTWDTLAYVSEKSIAVGLCRYAVCSLSIVSWEDGKLTKSAQTFSLEPGASIHSASEGRVLTILTRPPNILYSADLSTFRKVPIDIAQMSPSGKTVSEWARGSWKVYDLADKLVPIRAGKGELQSLSDELLAIQDGKTLRIETVNGEHIGQFSLPGEAWGHAALLGRSRLYVDDCTKARILDLDGNVHLELHPKDLYKQGSRWLTDASVCSQGGKSSFDGRRLLFDFATRRVPLLQHLLENVRTVATLGMSGPEDVNAEEVRVIDTNTGKLCFSWHRSFPSANWLVQSAAISPSGDSVAIVAGDTLSIYRLPDRCTSMVSTND